MSACGGEGGGVDAGRLEFAYYAVGQVGGEYLYVLVGRVHPFHSGGIGLVLGPYAHYVAVGLEDGEQRRAVGAFGAMVVGLHSFHLAHHLGDGFLYVLPAVGGVAVVLDVASGKPVELAVLEREDAGQDVLVDVVGVDVCEALFGSGKIRSIHRGSASGPDVAACGDSPDLETGV